MESENEEQRSTPAADQMPASPGIVPQKRKEPPSTADSTPTSSPVNERAPNHTNGASQIPKSEADGSHVRCDTCEQDIPIRDEGGFTVKHWDVHKMSCQNARQQSPKASSGTPEPSVESPSQPPNKRRRPKRNEEERIAYLRNDPYVAQFEAYRVLCASCDKWIRLRPNSTYCSIPWDAHRKSCLAKRNRSSAKNGLPCDDRSSLFAKDPLVRKFDTERVQCKNCEQWISLGSADNTTVVQTWTDHKNACLQGVASSSTTPVASTSNVGIPTADSVPPPSKHLLAMVQNSMPLPASITQIPPSLSPSTFKDLNPSNFPPAQESRRRNAEQRAAALRSDPLIGEVEPNRVFCSLCQKWVQLRQDSSYCAYPWLQHRSKCLNKQQNGGHRRAQREAEYVSAGAFSKSGMGGMGMEDSEEPESEEGVESGAEDSGKAARRQEKRKAKDVFGPSSSRKKDIRKPPTELTYPEDVDAEGEPDFMDIDSLSLADLDSPAGRLEFAFKSVSYLFRTTYANSDELTIATLMTYLNAAMPPDKHEDFDTTEVTKAAMALHERGDFIFVGDVIRLSE
ncbi:hypothetical protein QCA50_010546 [Cerrena zonata]|uniref:Uncharacterized protein n=1 Tax=Cerrena zonata TaxID=2478898 RepID=A0AAW0G8Z9_9APHY